SESKLTASPVSHDNGRHAALDDTVRQPIVVDHSIDAYEAADSHVTIQRKRQIDSSAQCHHVVCQNFTDRRAGACREIAHKGSGSFSVATGEAYASPGRDLKS